MSSLFSKPRRLVCLSRYLRGHIPRAIQRRLSPSSRVLSGAAAHLAVLVTGGVGDHIVAARFLRDLQSAAGPFDFDVFSPNPPVAEWILGSVTGYRRSFFDLPFPAACSRYAAALEASSILKIRHESPQLMNRALSEIFVNVRNFSSRIEGMLSISHRPDGFIAQRLQFDNATRATSLHHIARIAYGGDAFPLPTAPGSPEKFGITATKYITIHNGFETQQTISGVTATKCYPRFAEVVSLLKKEYPAVSIVQIGAANSVPIPGTDRCLLGKTTLREASALVQGSLAHLGNESGMVHIASCFAVPSCVVFGPTPPDYFAYPKNASVRPPQCGGCWWIADDWMDRCPRGFAEPVCTHAQPPAAVAQAMSELLVGANLYLKTSQTAAS